MIAQNSCRIATVVFLLLAVVGAFQPAYVKPALSSHRNSGRTVSVSRLLSKGDIPGFEEDINPEDLSAGEDYKGSVDWDAEWKKVATEQKKPGSGVKDPYKGDVEKAAIKVRNAAQSQLNKVERELIKNKPDIKSLQGDWKFWIGILAIISVAAALISASGQTQSYSNESFYV
uniref:Uncharacterized protein n=1 Tax=Attheya septentrionalis TaxID=420275 RepID=A0A7S2UHD2_9STRA|mmetsp:Transcript_22649/g.40908  ORF Transcript_22649/g.40908 Transcript_22649/m.40908 type:complete len:173 (+) Transcript_22649:201-719(+)|eukprot:CAMPEP_0198296736 /NCGR_PEP_ID=MMETSP1449-20131203/33723_1 /TAXON_ID=420275 /ORGANISM="Attheya septentrionalis, Strain CCMP2084" /LENGTH=172 /DNA_ID=CAMNT_0043997431 /DNA_START=143 /DNA_END=661 /DNA_ORIENTATION=+